MFLGKHFLCAVFTLFHSRGHDGSFQGPGGLTYNSESGVKRLRTAGQVLQTVMAETMQVMMTMMVMVMVMAMIGVKALCLDFIILTIQEDQFQILRYLRLGRAFFMEASFERNHIFGKFCWLLVAEKPGKLNKHIRLIFSLNLK